jgi:hypothetical protein
MRCKDGWYPIESVVGIPLKDQAKEHGEANLHVIKVETRFGEILWGRKIH